MRSQRGQTGAEYLGILLIVSLVVGALAAGGIGDAVAARTEYLVCKIGGSTGCQEPPPPRSASPGDESDAPREIYDAHCKPERGDPVRHTGEGPSGNSEADAAYTNLGRVYDYYQDTFGRDSYDGKGADLIATINFCEKAGVPLQNAYWDGTQMKFGEGYASALDITAHELTHAVTERTAGLEYQCQSGALNEAISDIFASNVDGNWEIGEDLPDGAIRDMADPSKGHPPQPATVDDFVVMENDGTPFSDYGGVHYNSGIINHAYYLLVQAIGRDKAQRIVYKALTEHLEPDSDFEDFRDATLQAAEELYGKDGTEHQAVDDAMRGVGLDGRWEAPEVKGC
jgi:bacillolysin